MVDGVHGYINHAVKHVVVEQDMSLDSVTILNLHVEEMTAMVVAIILKDAIMFAVLVRLVFAMEHTRAPTFIDLTELATHRLNNLYIM